MARSDGSVIIDTRINTNGFNKGVGNMKNSLTNLSGTVGKLGVAIAAAFAVKAVVNFGKECVNIGSDLAEVQNVVDVTFGSMSDQVNEFAKNAIAQFGLSELAAKQYTSTMGAMLKSMGVNQGQALEMSTALAGLAGDLASFYNLSGDDAFAKLRSGIAGETEPLKQLGINLSVANLEAYALSQGITKAYNAMTEQEKAVLRYNYILHATADAQGDFARTSDSWANQTRILSEQFNSLKASIGQGLIAALTPVVKFLNTIIAKLQIVADAFKNFMEMLFGKQSTPSSSKNNAALSSVEEMEAGYSGIGDSATAAGDQVSKSYDGMADSAKDAKKAQDKLLSGLDEIRTISTKDNADMSNISFGDLSDSGLGAGAGAAMDFGKFEEGETVLDKVSDSMSALIERAKELAGIFKKGFFDGLGDPSGRLDTIRQAVESIKESLSFIFDGEMLGAFNGFLDDLTYALGQLVGSVASIGLSIGANITGGIAKWLNEDKERIKSYLIDMFDIGGDIALMLGDFASSLAYIFESVASEEGQQLTANLIGIVASKFMGITKLGAKLGRDLVKVITQPFIENKQAFQSAFVGLFAVLSEVTGTIKTAIDDTFSKIHETYDKYFLPLFENIASGISDIVGAVLAFWNETLQPVLMEWAAGFDALWQGHIQPFINKFIELIGSLADFINELWINYLQPLVQWIVETILPILVPIFNSLWTTISTVFGAIMDILSAFMDIFKGVVDLVTALINGDWSAAWDACLLIVEGAFNAIFAVIDTVIQTILGVIDLALQTILGIFETIFTTILNFLSNTWETIKTRTEDFFKWAVGGFSENLNKIKTTWDNIWESLKSKVTGIWDSITSVVSGAVEKIKGWINSLFSLFDRAKSEASSVSSSAGSGSSRRSSILYSSSKYSVKIPKLASGAVIPPNAPFYAQLGDQKHGTNLEAPEELIRKIVREESGGVNGNVTIPVYVDGNKLLEILIDKAKLMQASTGTNVLAELG